MTVCVSHQNQALLIAQKLSCVVVMMIVTWSMGLSFNDVHPHHHSQWCFARWSLAPLRNKELSPSCGFKVMWPGPPVGLYLAPGAWRALCMREYTLLHITFSFRCQQCIKSLISSFAPKAVFFNSLRDDSVVHWTQAWCLI